MNNLLRRPAKRDRTARGGAAHTKWWVAGLAVALVLAVGGSAWLHWSSTPDDPVAAAPVGPMPSFAQAPTADPVKDCPKRVVPTQEGVTIQQVAPPPTTWTLLGGIATPSSPATGPAAVNPLRACYSHDPWGALFAATNYAAQLVDPNMDPAVVVKALAADTPERATYLKQIADRKVAPGPSRPYGSPQWTGFHFIGYAQDFANIELAHVFAGGITVNTVGLHWKSGDWLVVIPAEGDQHPAREMGTTETNFTPWGGA